MDDRNDTVMLDKPRTRQARDTDSGDVRAIWHVLHEHDGKLKAIDRDLIEMRRAINDMAVSIAVLSKTVNEIDQKFDAKLTQQFLMHEKRESEMQVRLMVRGLLLVITAFGSLAYFLLNKVVLAMGAS